VSLSADRSCEGLYHEHWPSTRRYPLPITTDSIAQKLPPHAPSSTADREQHRRTKTPSTRRRQLPIATNSIATVREGTATVRHTEKKFASGSTLDKC
jgi:hypothetical protein